jgi:hypothetical protein
MPIDTINDLTPRVQYVASAAQTDFDYPFPIFADGDLVVDVDGVTQVLATDYTVAGEGDDTGGTVTFLSGMTGNEVVTIYRDMSIERTTDFSQNGAFSSSAFNDELDRITLVQQDLAQQVRRSLRIPMTAEVTDAQAELSPLSNWLGKYVYINASGVPEPASVLSTGVTFTQATIGETLWPISTAETSAGLVAADLNEHYPYGHILRYGTNSTPGTTSMSVAMQAAVDQFEQGGAVPYVPKEAGVCNFSASVVLPRGSSARASRRCSGATRSTRRCRGPTTTSSIGSRAASSRRTRPRTPPTFTARAKGRSRSATSRRARASTPTTRSTWTSSAAPARTPCSSSTRRRAARASSSSVARRLA